MALGGRFGCNRKVVARGLPKGNTSSEGSLANGRQALVAPTTRSKLQPGKLIMRFTRNLLAAASFVSTLALLSLNASAHGGTYRGPGDVVPPGGGGGGGGGFDPANPGTGPGQPSAPTPGDPSPARPGTGNSGGPPGAGARAPKTPDGGYSEDLTQWSFWWEFNKPGYIGLRDALQRGGTTTGSGEWYLGLGTAEQGVDISRPSREQITDLVVPALLRALENETHNDVVTGALLALAKIKETPREDGTSPFTEVFVPWLKDANQEISETAALALGILGHAGNVPLLDELLQDSAEGRRATGRQEVPRRTRAFAAYGLGLIGRSAAQESVKVAILDRLRATLESESSSTRDVAVACVISMGLFSPTALGLEGVEQAADQPAGSLVSCEKQLAYLMELFQDTDQSRFLRAHCPTAMVRILEARRADLEPTWKAKLAKPLLAALFDSSEKKEVVQSCVLALGALGDCDSDDLDKQIRKALIQVPKRISDQQARNFSLISLAQVGAREGSDDAFLSEIQTTLLARLSGSKNALRSWSAIGMGVLARGAGERYPVSMTEALGFQLGQQRGPNVSAYAVAAGLVGDESLTTPMLEKLEQIQDDTARGYLCLGLGLIGDRRAIGPVQELVKSSTYRAELLRQAAIGLGLLGDQGAVGQLLDTLGRTESLGTKAAVAEALGFIGDRRSIVPLIEMLEDANGTALARGFAAAALGNVCDMARLPWNAPIASNINYRAATESLTGLGGRGILDIL